MLVIQLALHRMVDASLMLLYVVKTSKNSMVTVEEEDKNMSTSYLKIWPVSPPYFLKKKLKYK